MIQTVNECLLNGQDYLFIVQSLEINNLNMEIERISANLMLSLFFDVVIGVAIVLMIWLAVLIRPRAKGGSNFLLVTVAIAAIILTYMTYNQFTKKDVLQKEVAAKAIAINDLDQPDLELFSACIEPTAVLKKLPNSESKSSYQQVIRIME